MWKRFEIFVCAIKRAVIDSYKLTVQSFKVGKLKQALYALPGIIKLIPRYYHKRNVKTCFPVTYVFILMIYRKLLFIIPIHSIFIRVYKNEKIHVFLKLSQ